METQDQRNPSNYQTRGSDNDNFRSRMTGRVMAAFIIIAVGVVLLVRTADIIAVPDWLLSWPMILLAVGLYIGVRHNFRGAAWLIMIIIGSIFLIDQFDSSLDFHDYMLPVIVISIGLVMLFRPQKKNRGRRYDKDNEPVITNMEQAHAVTAHTGRATSDDFIDNLTVFGGVKKNIISKTFQGGEITTFFGGTELNLMQADINGRAVIEITQIFGGTKLIVPPNWKVVSDDLVAIFGGLDDKRPIQMDGSHDPNKVLVLRGTCIFGGIDIRSY